MEQQEPSKLEKEVIKEIFENMAIITGEYTTKDELYVPLWELKLYMMYLRGGEDDN